MGQVDLLRRVFRGVSLIPLTQAAEPADFQHKVRRPGAAYLRRTPRPKGVEWNGKDYWRKALGDLFVAYKGICAYCASWTRRGDSSVDHFEPKSVQPGLAYEWKNFRLSRRRLNGLKGSYRDVLDPFSLADGWFKLDFRTFLLVPNPQLSATDRSRVTKTIERLQLNDDDYYVNERLGAVREYCLGKAAMTQLATSYPFIAAEMVVQDYDAKFLPRHREVFASQS